MNVLNITDFWCDKPRGRPQAWIRFLNIGDGSAFLEKHGKHRRPDEYGKENMNPNFSFRPNSRPRDTPRLYILRTPVFVEQSHKPVDKHTIAHFKYEREKKKKETASATKKDRHAQAKAFNIADVRCGGNTFWGENDILTFVDHNKLVLPRNVTGKFTSQWLTVQVAHGNRMDFHNETIQDLIAGRSDLSLTLVLTEPPRMYIRRLSSEEHSTPGWSRVQGLSTWGLPREYSSSCLVYRIYLYDITSFDEVLGSLKNKDALAITNHALPSVVWNTMPPENNHFLGRQMFTEKAKRLLASGVHFALLFQVQALVWNNYINPASGIKLLGVLEAVIKDANEKQVAPAVTTDAMKKLFQSLPYPCPGIDPRELDVVSIMAEIMDAEYEARRDNPERDRVYGSKLPAQHIWIFKALVTPTRVLLTGPDADSKNRVLRKYSANNDYFLRVVFCDEDGQSLSFHPKIDNEPIYSQFRRTMDEGIQIVGRKYHFLGFSHSSLRSHSAWFSAPFTGEDFRIQTPEAILKDLGDFEDIRVPAKCAARIGQAFSETPYAVPIFETDIAYRFIHDVKSADGSRVFSHGVGTISQDALEEV